MRPTTILAAALIGWGVFAHTGFDKPGPAPLPDRPSASLLTAVKPVTAILKGHTDDGMKLATFYSAVADVLARDQGKVITTTAQLRELHRRAGLLMFQKSGIEGKYPGLAEAIDKVLADSVGLDNVTLDAEKCQHAIDAFKAFAWACGGGHA
jgi:hypothetical protein